jgi:4-azaleucine resistance transporter AzlC
MRVVRYTGRIVRHSEQSRRREIRRQGLSIGLAVAPVGVAFGIASTEAGLALWQASAFSLLVFAGSAQFAAVEILGDGGTIVAAIVAGVLLNLRSLAFGVIMTPALQGPRWRRAVWSQVMVDETAAVGSAQQERSWQRYGYLWTGLVLFVSWNLATVLGATTIPSTGDVVADWGLDAAFPAIFLALLWPRLADLGQRRSALVGAVIALALVPVAPAGVPIVVAGIGALAGWRRDRRVRT